MKRLVIYIFILTNSLIFAQNGSLSGKIVNSKTGEELQDVNVFVVDQKIGTTTNKNGEYFLDKVSQGEYSVRFSHLGYETKIISIIVSNLGVVQNIELEPVPVTLGTVTVKSTKSEKLLREVELPMEITGREKIEKESPATAADILTKEAGVSITRDGIWATDVNIRGLSKQNVVTLIDGNRVETATNISAGLSLIDMNDVEKVEVIKGGISSIYGSGATGGVINIQTKGASFNDDFYLSGSVEGTYNSVNEGSFGNLQINSGSRNWRLKLNGTSRNATDVETPAGTLKDSRFRDRNISTELGVEFFNDQELIVDYQNFYASDVGIPGGSPFPLTASARYPTEKREMYSAEYKFNRLSPSLLNLSVKYFHQLIEREAELKPNAVVTVNPRADHNTDGILLQSNWLIGNHYLVAGFDGWQRKYKGIREKFISNQNKIIGDFPIPESRYRSIGVYAKDEIKLIDNRISLTAGGRYDFINITSEEALNPNYIISNGVKNSNPPRDPLASFDASDVNNYSWSGNVGILYSASRETDLTFNLGRSFRSPNLEERFQYIDLAGRIYLGNPELKPEIGTFLDLGFRRWNKNFMIRANIFLNLFDDLVIDKENVPDSLFIKDNVGKARLYGFDLSFEYNISENYVLYGTAAYVRGEDTEQDSDLPEIPPLNGSIGIRFPLLDLLNIDISATVFDEQENVALGEKTTPGYAFYDLFVYTNRIKFSQVDIQFFGGVENIGDKLYRNHLATNRGFINYEPGRNFFIKAKLSW